VSGFELFGHFAPLSGGKIAVLVSDNLYAVLLLAEAPVILGLVKCYRGGS